MRDEIAYRVNSQSELFSDKSVQCANECGSGNKSGCLSSAIIPPAPVSKIEIDGSIGLGAETTTPITAKRHAAASFTTRHPVYALTSENSVVDTMVQPNLVSRGQLNSNRPVKLETRKRLTKNQSLREEAVKNATSPIKCQHYSEHKVMFFCCELVARRYDVSVACIWRWVKEGKFPDPIKLTNGTTRRSRSTLEDYDQNQGSSK